MLPGTLTTPVPDGCISKSALESFVVILLPTNPTLSKFAKPFAFNIDVVTFRKTLCEFVVMFPVTIKLESIVAESIIDTSVCV